MGLEYDRKEFIARFLELQNELADPSIGVDKITKKIQIFTGDANIYADAYHNVLKSQERIVDDYRAMLKMVCDMRDVVEKFLIEFKAKDAR